MTSFFFPNENCRVMVVTPTKMGIEVYFLSVAASTLPEAKGRAIHKLRQDNIKVLGSSQVTASMVR